MNRMTIDVGIDLGTTNSAIAIFRNGKAELLRNNDGSDITPSVVAYVRGRLYVGEQAKHISETSPENVQFEFKRHMGSNYSYEFKESKIRMSPEEMSSEILKMLAMAYHSRVGEHLTAAVITVPAAFELPQCEATNEAGKLAGFEQVILLQEPIAAAIAYGFQQKSENVYWLVYDFGGGTFDAALINPREGMFRVVNHKGDNHLGGKDIDRTIIDEIITPQVREETGFNDFRSGNALWRIPLVKLRNEVEKAKIQLSRTAKAPIYVPDLFRGIHDIQYDFECELFQDDVAELAKPLIIKTIRLCKELVAESGLTPNDIEKIILVGGPTNAPYVRDLLQDPDEGLGIPLEFGIDPLTVVAQGAAIFAGTQPLEKKSTSALSEGKFQLELIQYERIGSDPDPFIGGKLIHPNKGEAEKENLRIEFKNSKWSSGLIDIGENGYFSTNLWAEADMENVYDIFLYDKSGIPLEIEPNQISYIIGNAIAKPILINSIGVALANNDVAIYLKKGEPLPTRRKKQALYTTKNVYRGDSSSMIRVPIIEGENPKADRNPIVGYLDIPAINIKRDVPAGSEIEITIEVDESRNVKTSAFIPFLDLEIDKVHKLEKKTPQDTSALEQMLEIEIERLNKIEEKLHQIDDPTLLLSFWEINDEDTIKKLKGEIDNSRADIDAAISAERHILELRIAIDKLEADVEIPFLESEERDNFETIEYCLERQNNPQAKGQAQKLREKFRKAIQNRDTDSAEKILDDLLVLGNRLYYQLPESHHNLFRYLQKDLSKYSDQHMAQQLFIEGNRAVQNNNLPQLIEINQKLLRLLPDDEQNNKKYDLKGYGSSVIR